jgi:hypothetical protein
MAYKHEILKGGTLEYMLTELDRRSVDGWELVGNIDRHGEGVFTSFVATIRKKVPVKEVLPEGFTIPDGTVLFTRDGSNVGNAVILSQAVDEQMPNLGTIYKIQTDFGNTTALTLSEVMDAFTIGPVTNIDRRNHDQMCLLTGNKHMVIGMDDFPDTK